MSIPEDIEQIKTQESRLQFASFDAGAAWQIGRYMRDRAVANQLAITFEIQLAGRTMLYAAADGAPAGQADWIRRKRNTVFRFGKSTYLVGLQLQAEGNTLEQRHGLSLTDYAAHGGGFPLILRGSGIVGSIIVSGLAQRDDHNLVVDALSAHLGVSDIGLR